MKLNAKGRYHSAFYHVDRPGVIDVDQGLGERLLADAPEIFEVAVEREEVPEPAPVIVETEAFDTPPRDKMIKTSRKKGL